MINFTIRTLLFFSFIYKDMSCQEKMMDVFPILKKILNLLNLSEKKIYETTENKET